MGTFHAADAIFEPSTDFIRYMPAAAFIPLIMLYVGIGETAKILMIFIGTYFQLVLLVAAVARSVPMDVVNVAYTLGASQRQVLQACRRAGQFARTCRESPDYPGLGVDLRHRR